MRRVLAHHLGLLLVLFTSAAASVFAHPAPYSYLDIRISQTAIEATLTAHTLDLAHDLNVTPADSLLDPSEVTSKQAAILELLRTRLSLSADSRPLRLELLRLEPLPERQALALQLRWAVTSAPGQLKIQGRLFPYDLQHQTFLNLYEADALVRQEILSQSQAAIEHVTNSRQGTRAAFMSFLINGFFHIIAGADHILFLVGLLLLGGSLPRLLIIVTAFTVAHSITLTLAALNFANPNIRVVEAAIALSIVYVGVDNLMVGTTGRDVRAWIACFFGLVHGFGVATVLRENRLSDTALGWSIFSFNLGVEAGQICLVVLFTSVLASVRQRYPSWEKRIVVCGSLAIIAAGSYWFVQRVFFGG